MTGEVEQDFWRVLRELTPARIGLRRAGASLGTEPLLDFKLAHARARDAVHEALDEEQLLEVLGSLGVVAKLVASAAENRQQFLLRPDLGRRLAGGAKANLLTLRGDYDVAFVIADGLSARAVQSHAPPLLAGVLPKLRDEGWRIAPLIVVRNGRVAIADQIATALNAKCVAVLIGERPGLTAPDSMGLYLTWEPRTETTDARRNCISNIRPLGLGYVEAGFKMIQLLHAMLAQCVSGIQLKDDSEALRVTGGERT
jgi:ethanolamine ammonia-lyase small subunit